MRSAGLKNVLAVVLLAFVAASALGTFPHPHAEQLRAATEAENSPGTHAPRPVECVEKADGAGTSECAICFFQRVASHGQFVEVPALDTVLPDRGVMTSTLTVFVADSICLGDPRGPPTI